jgi:hypothetical protein
MMAPSEQKFELPPSDMLHDAHSEQRAMERYGVAFTENDRLDIRSQIRENRAIFVSGKTGSSHVKVWLVWWHSAQRIVPVYYHEGRIKSVLPTAALQNLFERLEGLAALRASATLQEQRS